MGKSSHAFYFLTSAAWNLALGMIWLPIPLYAHSLGLSNAEIGLLFSVPILLQAPLNLIGGAYADRIGARRVLIWSCAGYTLGGLWFVFSAGFWMLMAGQVILIVGRAAFWPANWSMATQLPGDRGVQLGRLNATTNIGQILGTALSGVLLSAVGFTWSFVALAAVGILASLAALGTPHPAPRPAGPQPGVFAAYQPLMRRPVIFYMMICAYVSAMPFSVGTSFLPILLENYRFGADASGFILTLRAFGSIGASLLIARFVRTGPESLWPVACASAIAFSVGVIPLVNHALPIGAGLLLMGIGSAMMTLYFQYTIADASSTEQRGSALALGGIGWSLSHISVPLIMGFAADRYGLEASFYVICAVGFVLACVIAWMRRWAFSGATGSV